MRAAPVRTAPMIRPPVGTAGYAGAPGTAA